MNAPLPVIESAVLMPSIGDDVLFRLNGLKVDSPPLVSITCSDAPMHAKVVYVWGPEMVNLVLWDHYGHMHTLTSVKFLPPGEDVPVGQTYCELDVIHGEPVEGTLDFDALHESDLVDTTEQAIVQAGADKAPRVTPADVDTNIVSEHYFTAADGFMGANDGRMKPADPDARCPISLGLLTFCVLVLRNGFTVTGESACASPENFNPEIGRRIARENAVAKVWPLMGYELRTKLATS